MCVFEREGEKEKEVNWAVGGRLVLLVYGGEEEGKAWLKADALAGQIDGATRLEGHTLLASSMSRHRLTSGLFLEPAPPSCSSSPLLWLKSSDGYLQ